MPIEAAVSPFPSDETTPPVTKMCFVGPRFLGTGAPPRRAAMGASPRSILTRRCDVLGETVPTNAGHRVGGRRTLARAETDRPREQHGVRVGLPCATGGHDDQPPLPRGGSVAERKGE